jgi:hypothetical protein
MFDCIVVMRGNPSTTFGPILDLLPEVGPPEQEPQVDFAPFDTASTNEHAVTRMVIDSEVLTLTLENPYAGDSWAARRLVVPDSQGEE